MLDSLRSRVLWALGSRCALQACSRGCSNSAPVLYCFRGTTWRIRPARLPTIGVAPCADSSLIYAGQSEI